MVKEADALANMGYDVTVFYMYWNKWGAEFDKQLIPSRKWNATCIGGDPENKRLIYFFSRLIHKLAKIISNITKGKFMTDIAAARASFFLIKAAKKQTADLYIGHNFGALPATVIAAKKNNKPCGFDAEDFHRHETSNNASDTDVVLKTLIEGRYIPQLKYFTTSSLQIAKAYRQIFPDLKPVVLLNVFTKDGSGIIRSAADQPIKLFWFSQTIGHNRGIDDIVKALQLLDRSNFELHLLGSTVASSNEFINSLKKSNINIHFHEPIHPDKLIGFASQFDIGLALEPGFSINNNLALSNKLFTYMQAGLAIIASDTDAQQDFLTQNPTIGTVYSKGDYKKLATILSGYHIDRETLNACKTDAKNLASTKYNWETESLKFLRLVNTQLL